MPDGQGKWTEADTDHLFATIGRYVVLFQELEAELDQILLIAWGYENWKVSQAKLAQLKNSAKIAEVEKAVLSEPAFARARERPEWIAKFQQNLDLARLAGRKRNSLLHSQFLLQFADAGMPPIISDRRKEGEGYRFDRWEATNDAQKQLLTDLTETFIAIAAARIQLIHDHNAPLTKEAGGQ